MRPQKNPKLHLHPFLVLWAVDHPLLTAIAFNIQVVCRKVDLTSFSLIFCICSLFRCSVVVETLLVILLNQLKHSISILWRKHIGILFLFSRSLGLEASPTGFRNKFVKVLQTKFPFSKLTY